jgi:hypothetical protein
MIMIPKVGEAIYRIHETTSPRMLCPGHKANLPTRRCLDTRPLPLIFVRLRPIRGSSFEGSKLQIGVAFLDEVTEVIGTYQVGLGARNYLSAGIPARVCVRLHMSRFTSLKR